MKRRIVSFESFKYNESNDSWETSEDMCDVCKCPCDDCECNEEEDWKMHDDTDKEMSEQLVQSVKASNMRQVSELLESGADLSYRRYYPIKKAIESGNMRMVEMLFSQVDANDIELEDAEELVEHCEYKETSHRMRSFVETKVFEISEKKKSYKKSGLKNPEKADLDKDGKLSAYEKKRGAAIQKSVQKEKEEKGSKGLTAKQKKLPPALRAAIEKRMKK